MPDGSRIAVTFVSDYMNYDARRCRRHPLTGEYVWNYVIADNFCHHADFLARRHVHGRHHSVRWYANPVPLRGEGLLTVDRDGTNATQLTTGNTPRRPRRTAHIAFESEGQIARGGRWRRAGASHDDRGMQPTGARQRFHRLRIGRQLADHSGTAAPRCLTSDPSDADPTGRRAAVDRVRVASRRLERSVGRLHAADSHGSSLPVRSDTQPACCRRTLDRVRLESRRPPDVWIATDPPDATVPVTPLTWTAAKELWRSVARASTRDFGLRPPAASDRTFEAAAVPCYLRRHERRQQILREPMPSNRRPNGSSKCATSTTTAVLAEPRFAACRASSGRRQQHPAAWRYRGSGGQELAAGNHARER